jgi:hypothetical protein
MKIIYFLRKHYIFSGFLILLLIGLLIARLYLSAWLLNYVNETLNNIEGYQGSVESIDVDLYRGAYRIHRLKIYKTAGHIPTPFLDIDTVDLSVQWRALFHGRIVSDIDLYKPIINFAVNKTGKVTQTGEGTNWTKPIKALAPFDINHVIFKEGKLTYQDFSTTPKVDIYIHHMQGEVSNLRNVEDASKPLPSTLVLSGDSIGNGQLKMKGKLNILKKVPDMELATSMENISLPALNNYSNAYVAIDIKEGSLSVYSELKVINDHVSGYIKPIATNISLIDIHRSANPIKLAWESVVSAVVILFTNHHHDQFATKIELEGNLDNINTNAWSAIGGILENAFIGALKKGIEHDTTPSTSAPTK